MPIHPFSISGYRSFGQLPQRFERIGKLNLLIGPNNCGKSNVLRFLNEVIPRIGAGNLELDHLDRHFPGTARFRYGICVSLRLDDDGKAYSPFIEYASKKLRSTNSSEASHLIRILQKKAELDGTKDAWFHFGEDRALILEANWEKALELLADWELRDLWSGLTGQSGGSRKGHWTAETLRRIVPEWSFERSVCLIPAIRRISAQDSSDEWFGGTGLVGRLARLQNPNAFSQADRSKFEKINNFLRSVTENATATIEIPHERDTIIVHIDGRALPLESLGTGIHEVIILAASATILENAVLCMEEPELHLNPVLQRKLVQYLIDATSNQYFVTTHSATLMDAIGAEIYHLQLHEGATAVTRVTSDRQRSAVCETLGYHPSDLLQANCIVWVEGPSDRLYLKFWIGQRAPDLQEGVHFSIMFYGGRLAAHLTAEDFAGAVDEFISLRRLNRRASILIDSDFSSPKKQTLNDTKRRLVEEFNKGPGHAWVTYGREIENYLPPQDVKAAICARMPKAIPRERFHRFDRFLEISGPQKTKFAPKVEVARHVVEQGSFDDSRFDLAERLNEMIAFIRQSNPSRCVQS